VTVSVHSQCECQSDSESGTTINTYDIVSKLRLRWFSLTLALVLRLDSYS